ncbi:hypothetical protein P5V15_011530 [Pogonomyrmex californicus]
MNNPDVTLQLPREEPELNSKYLHDVEKGIENLTLDGNVNDFKDVKQDNGRAGQSSHDIQHTGLGLWHISSDRNVRDTVCLTASFLNKTVTKFTEFLQSVIEGRTIDPIMDYKSLDLCNAGSVPVQPSISLLTNRMHKLSLQRRKICGNRRPGSDWIMSNRHHEVSYNWIRIKRDRWRCTHCSKTFSDMFTFKYHIKHDAKCKMDSYLSDFRIPSD